MKRKTKQEIKGILSTLRKAQDHVALLLQQHRVADANNLLSQCQDCAQQVGEAIERSEGLGMKAVTFLEEYCEELYQLSRNPDKKSRGAILRKMEKILYQVENEVEEVLPLDRMKVVFLPYKASMWDCMESVWEAAEADEECDAYVVPIPFYEKNQQGAIERDCYEGNQFPSYVPITPYEQFSLEVEQPDIIYIHNPYDNNNYVTSVHPEYYSSNLKNYTGILVYIPYYFSGDGPLPDSHLDLPAYHHVDKIIVQDQKKADSLLDIVPEEKILVMGSPKIDRLRKLEKKRDEIIQQELPAEWRKKIVGKKVVLFNVSVSGILQHSKYALAKIRYVLSQFENRDDVLLLWRPHPLVEATLKSMRPAMYREYMEIKRGFLRSGKGILDETGDAGIAAVIADAYLGEDSSSLVHYFGVLGKPVFYIDWDVLEDEKKDRDFLYFSTYYMEGDDMFFVPSNAGMGHDLYRLNLESGIMDKVMTFPGTPNNAWTCYHGIKKVENKIVLIPRNTEDVYIYDLEKKQATKLVLSNSTGRIMLFSEAVEYDGKLFLLPLCYPAIVSINLQNLMVEEFKECIKPFALADKNMPLFDFACLKRGSYLYLASRNDSRMLIFSLKDGSFKIRKIGDYSYGYIRMIFDGEYFWLSAYKENCIVRWNERTGETKEYIYPIDKEQPKETVWCTLFDNEDEIIICYSFCLDIIFMNKITGTFRKNVSTKNMLKKMEKESINETALIWITNYPNKETALVFNWRNNSINEWDVKTNQWREISCKLPIEEMLEMEKKQIEKYKIFRGIPYYLKENAVTISQFIDYLTNGNTNMFKCMYECYQGETGECDIGTGIHKNIKELFVK